MRTLETGFGGIQVLLVAATFAALSFVVTPEYPTPSYDQQVRVEKTMIAEALDFAGESQRKIAQSFRDGNALPRTADEADAMKPNLILMPETVREVRIQHDYAGETVVIMAYLHPGVTDNILGGAQYVYVAGIRSDEGDGTLKWRCSARNVDLFLLPEECRS